jgi:hypothetical protein
MSVVINGTTGITSPALDANGNLTFSGNARRITGDFSNGTVANRVAFQTSTANSATSVYAIPSGTSSTASFVASNQADPTNSGLAQMLSLSSEVSFRAATAGNGFPAATFLPMTFYTGGSERVRIDTSGNVGIGTSSPRTYVVGPSRLQVEGLGANEAMGAIHRVSDTLDAPPRLVLGRSGGTTIGSMAAPPSFASIGAIDFRVSDGTNFVGAAAIIASLEGAISTGNAPSALRFLTNNAERMRIDSSGNLLVGDTSFSTTSRLGIKASTANGATNGILVTNSSNTELLRVFSDGGFRTGSATFSPYNLTTGSAANVLVESDGTLKRSTSSLKYKTDVQDATHGLAEVMSLRSVTYKGKNDGDKVFGGLIAEEVHEAGLTEFVQYADDGTPDALSYGNMVALAFKAIQEQQSIIEQLKAEVAALKGAQA